MRVARETYAQLARFPGDTVKVNKMGSRPAPHFAFASDVWNGGGPDGVHHDDGGRDELARKCGSEIAPESDAQS